MQALGWTEGRNVEYLVLSAEGNVDRLDALTRQMVEATVDVIVAGDLTPASQICTDDQYI